ncbi:MAG TPA: hypothetical protein VMP01_05990 [Pirellulaceae bacterium]|nr:hypothetical protein [Pirellulaceae bacterium]
MSARHPSCKTRRRLALARTLHARVWISLEGRVFVAGGSTNFEKLRHCLTRRCAPPTAIEAPTPTELGIAACDGELTDYTLLAIGQALARWSRSLDEEEQRRPARRRQRPQIDAERKEIERLRARLAAVREWRRQLQVGAEPPGAPYLLDGRQEQGLRRALDAAPAGRPYPSLVAWLARVACWLSGSLAAGRFLQAAQVLADRWDELAPAEQLQRLERRLHVWSKRSRSERPYAILSELRSAVATLSPQFVSAAGLSSRPRRRSLTEHCELLLAKCRQLRGRQHAASWHRLPATLAAWAAADGGTAPLPPRVVALGMERAESHSLERLLASFAGQFGEPGYDRLLVAIEQLPELVCHGDVTALSSLLAKGATLDDLAWAAQHGQIWRLWAYGVKPHVARRIADRLAYVGIAVEGEILSALIPVLADSCQVALIERWIGWLGRFSSRTITPRLKRVLASACRELILPAVGQVPLHETLRLWLKPAAPLTRPIADGSPLADWLQRIAAYQSLAGQPISLPKSVRKIMEHSSQQASAACDWRRALRAAQEALVMIATSALRTLLLRRIEAWWRSEAGCSLADVPLPRGLSLAAWLGKMDQEQRDMLRQVAAGWAMHGADYKDRLPLCAPWLAKFRAHGGNADAWLHPAEETASLAGRQLTVSIAHDPREIFLMGDYFDTCLRVGNFNEMSVLANSHDANKQVVYLVGRSPAGKRQVVARQLIAVSSDFSLLGYQCYVAIDKRQSGERQECIAIMAAYCGRLARRSGIKLADEGTPEAIGSHFWYDDGAHAWHPAAQQAWNAVDQRQREASWALEVETSIVRGDSVSAGLAANGAVVLLP